MMNQTIKDIWVTALRSGQYAQTHGVLCMTDNEGKPLGYCCLGVLCELASKDCAPVMRNLNPVEHRIEFDGSIGYLPDSVIEWAGPDLSTDPVIKGRTLTKWNDEVKLSFAELADLIEEYL